MASSGSGRAGAGAPARDRHLQVLAASGSRSWKRRAPPNAQLAGAARHFRHGGGDAHLVLLAKSRAAPTPGARAGAPAPRPARRPRLDVEDALLLMRCPPGAATSTMASSRRRMKSRISMRRDQRRARAMAGRDSRPGPTGSGCRPNAGCTGRPAGRGREFLHLAHVVADDAVVRDQRAPRVAVDHHAADVADAGKAQRRCRVVDARHRQRRAARDAQRSCAAASPRTAPRPGRRSSASTARAALAASGPWPRPSTPSRVAPSWSQLIAQPSPHSSSPASGTYSAPTSAAAGFGRRAAAPQAHEEQPRPCRAALQTSNSSDWRRSAPRPVPAVPAVETPSCRLARGRRCRDRCRPPARRCPPCRARLGAHDVQRAFAGMLEDVGAGLGDDDRQAPRLDSLKPSSSASFWPARRAAEMSLA
jgi:hypothetical protein